MTYTIGRIRKVTAGTTAVDVDMAYCAFLIENLSSDQTVYIKEKDGEAATANNSFVIPAATVLEVPLRAKTLSILASAASTDVRIMQLTEE